MVNVLVLHGRARNRVKPWRESAVEHTSWISFVEIYTSSSNKDPESQEAICHEPSDMLELEV